ncbi:MAG TPA: PepSY domain-containing protein [Gemmatimonadota bacterium]|nr:PepSY domain-containing protein [Gemmatimonadota bacterium]
MRSRLPVHRFLLVLSTSVLGGLAAAAPLRAQATGHDTVPRGGRISRDSAAVVARSQVPGATIESAEYEHEGGRWVWSFDLEVPGRPGIQEVLVDASSGQVVSVQHESAAAEAGEAAQEKEKAEAGERGEAGEKAEAGEEGEEAERGEAGERREGFRRDFDLSRCDLSTTGRSGYMVLEPGYRLVLEGTESGHEVRLWVTVLEDTLVVDGHPTRVVEEREWHGGALAEVSRNYVAMCPSSGDAYYFGETTDEYRNGKVVGHEGSWRAGRDGAHAGLLLPGHPEVGEAYFQEVAPGVAMDRARVVSTSEKVDTPAGTFHGCLETRETTPLEPDASETKYYAPGVGLLVDESLRLVRHGMAGGADGPGR